jgi:hypothetical protein
MEQPLIEAGEGVNDNWNADKIMLIARSKKR